jgi:hypothetical protein
MTNLISRYLVRPASSATTFIVMLLLIPVAMVMMLLAGITALLLNRRLRSVLAAMQKENSRQQPAGDGLRTQKPGAQARPPIEGNYTVIENK